MNSLKKSDIESKAPIKWPSELITPSEFIKSLRRRTRLRIISSPIYSKIIMQFVGSWAYLLAHGFNKSRITNLDVFNRELRLIEQNQLQRSKNTNCDENVKGITGAPLITLSNHISCIDDPVLWASILPLTYYSTNTDSVRWSAAAIDICFSKPWHSTFFALGKTFPIVRGAGLNQPAMDFALALLRNNHWLHMFPEGRVMKDHNQQVISNEDRGYKFKWGISKLILDYFKAECNDIGNRERHLKILPFYHLGLDKILPIGRPYIPRCGKKISIYIKPTAITMNHNLLNDILTKRCLTNRNYIKSRSNDEIMRIKLTNFLEDEVEKLIEPTNELHSKD